MTRVPVGYWGQALGGQQSDLDVGEMDLGLNRYSLFGDLRRWIT